MTDNTQPSESHPRILNSVVGYTIVAAVCLLTGFIFSVPASITTNQTPSPSLVSTSFLDWLIKIPSLIHFNLADTVTSLTLLSIFAAAFLNGGLLYEQPYLATWADSPSLLKWLLGLGKYLPLLLFGYCLLWFCPLKFQTDGAFSFGYTGLFFLWAVLPLAIIAIWRTREWSRLLKQWETKRKAGSTDRFLNEIALEDQKPFLFRNRFLFPALCACTLPFVAGWCLSRRSLWPLFWCDIILISFWLISIKRSAQTLCTVGCCFLAILIGVATVSAGRKGFVSLESAITPILFGILLALSMGVAEAWRVVTKVHDNPSWVLPVSAKASRAHIERTYFAGANIATALCPLVFLLTCIHPYTTGFYHLGLILFYGAQIVAWFCWQNDLGSRMWGFIAMIAGLLPPILIVKGTSTVDAWIIPLSFAAPSSFEALLPAIAIVLGAAACIISPPPFLGVPKLEKGLSAYLKFLPCVQLIGVVSAGLLVLMFIVLWLWQSAEPASPDLAHIRFLILFYGFALLAALMIVFFPKGWLQSDEGNDAPTNLPPNNNASPTTKMKSLFTGLIETVRPPTSLIGGFFLFLWISSHASTTVGLAILRSIPIVLIAMAGFAANDIWDVEKDRLAGKRRPLAIGVVSTSSVVILILCLFTTSLAIEVIFGSANTFYFAIFIIAAVMLYSPFTWVLPIGKNLYTAFLCSSPLLYGAIISNGSIERGLYCTLIIFVVGRELLLDVRDFDGDKRSGCQTLAVSFGTKRSTIAAFAIMLISAIVLVFQVSGIRSILFACFTVASIFPVIVLWLRGSEQPAIVLSRLTLLLGTIAITLSYFA